ncbi:MAG: hypothetical protein Q9184_007898, partial [Pyrenodesmia sp. 2 TL-2023]
MRSPARPKATSTLPIHIAVLPDTTIADLPMPEPKPILVSRDVETHDWSTFVNHLIPHESAQPFAGVKGEAADEKEGAGIPHRPTDIDPGRTESERQHTVKAVAEEWNRGFFLPRGIEIVMQVEATPRLDTAVTNQSSRAASAMTPSPNLLSPAGGSPGQGLQSKPSKDCPKRAGQRNNDKKLGLALYRAVEKQDLQMCEVLLLAKADPNARPSHEAPAIVLAVEQDNVKLLKMLLKHGANVNACASGGGTALYNALSKGRIDLVKLLLSYNADPNSRPCGADPNLHKAVSRDFDEIVRLLLEHGVKVDDAPCGGSTSMYLAAVEKEDVELVELLLQSGARADARPCGSDTALVEAAKKGQYEMCRALLVGGAKVDARTCGGDTALYNVVRKKNERLMRLLLDHGADINAKSSGGESPLERAVSKGLKDA